MPVIRVTHLTPEQRAEYMVADNALALQSAWDAVALSDLLAGFDGGVRDMLALDLPDLNDIDLPSVDVSNDDRYMIVVELASESEQEAAYKKIKELGLSCRIMT